MSNKKFFIVIYPWLFTDTVYAQYDLDNFKPYCDIEIWDISKIIDFEYSNSIQVKRSNKKEIIVFEGLIGFIRHVKLLKAKSLYGDIYILNQINNNTLNEFICNFILRSLLNIENIVIFDLYNGGIPLQSFNDSAKRIGLKRSAKFLERLLFFRKRQNQ